MGTTTAVYGKPGTTRDDGMTASILDTAAPSIHNTQPWLFRAA
jgi:hypothetical protein